MPRPSRHLDRALLAAGRALLPTRGCSGLSVREVVDAAGVNLGMFHYHFKTREAFLRAVLQQLYEEMFAQLHFDPARDAGDLGNLRYALRVLGRFLRDNRAVLARVLADALCSDPIARAFIAQNAPRHLGILRQLLLQGQASGALRRLALPQALGICAGSLATPILLGGAIADSGALAGPSARELERALLSDAAIDERIDLALAAISAPPPPAGRKEAAR